MNLLLQSLVRKIVADDEVPDCLHKCTIAVQLADKKHYSRLEPRHQKNSSIFAKLMRDLRRESLAAVISKDKHGRIGLLVPMKNENISNDDTENINVEDCAAFCYTGTIDDVVKYLGGRAESPAVASNENPTSPLWQPPGQETTTESGSLWKPPTAENEDNSNGFSAPWQTDQLDTAAAPWETNNSENSGARWDASGISASGGKRGHEEMISGDTKEDDNFHTDGGAAAADAFYSGLTRKLDTRADSHLYHMRSFNGWVKATQISELDPRITINGKPKARGPLRVLDLACGKGGDLAKWSLHERGMSTYWYV